MPTCVAVGCTNRFSTAKKGGLTFHRFPTDLKRRRAWTRAICRKDWFPTKCSVLCSEHFTEDCFDRASTMRVYLKSTAVPTIFKAHPPHLQKLAETIAREFAREQCPVVESVPVSEGDRTVECSQEINSKPSPSVSDSEQDCESGDHVNSSTQADDENSMTACNLTAVGNESTENNCDSSYGRRSMQSDIVNSHLQTIADLQAQLQLFHNQRIQDLKKIKLLQQTIRRSRKKIASLEAMLDEKSMDFVIDDDDDDSLDTLEDGLKENEMFTIIHVG